MTIENEGAVAPANDTALPIASPETEAPVVENELPVESDEPELDEHGNEIEPAPVDDTEEVDYEGETVRVPKKLKDALLRHADYTRKTQEVADLKRALKDRLESAGTVSKDLVEALANVKAYDTALTRYENVDWTTFEQTDPVAAASEWRQFTRLKEARASADSTANTKQQALTLEQQRARATRTQEVIGQLQKILPEWAPDNDFEKTLEKFGTAQSLSRQDIAEATLRNPAWLKIVNLARIGAELQSKAATTKRIEAAQAVKPAAEVGSRSATATKDPARMSQAAYVKWRAAQG